MDSLLKTTFFNWDAVLYSLSSGKLFVSVNYIESINTRSLDFNFVKCPNELANVIKSLRYYEKFDANFSPRLARWVCGYLQNISTIDVYEKDLRSHESRVITPSDIAKIYKSLEQHSKTNSLFPMQAKESLIGLIFN